MAWFGSRQEESSNYSNKQKHKQIESLREYIPGVVEVKRDEQYTTTTTVNNLTLVLNIYLPPRFPLVSPEVTVSPPIQHPWVNDQMVVDGSPLLKNFTVHSKLGRAMDQVIREFQEHPPLPTSSPVLPYPVSSGSHDSVTGSSSSGIVLSPGLFSPGSGQGFGPYTFSSVPQSSSARVGAPNSPENRPSRPAITMSAGSNTVDGSRRYRCPPIPDKFEEISQKSTKELNKFLSDSDGTILVDDLVSKLDAIKMVQTDREHLFIDNDDQAAINIDHESELQDGWTQLQEKFLEMEALKEEHDKRLREQRHLIDRYQQRNVIAQLKTAVNEADVESEMYADHFLEAKVPLAEFIQKYKQLRKLYHLRKTKYEKLVH